jgi:rhodanese-related sulfurtransferase
MLAEARSRIPRYTPAEAAAADDILLVDLRSTDERREHGVIPGSVHVPRSVLEWRADPTSENHNPELAGKRLVLVCAQGYSSRLAAASLVQLGVDAGTSTAGSRRGRRPGFPSDEDRPGTARRHREQLVDVHSFTGDEQRMADLMASIFDGMDLQVQRQQVEDNRANALGTWVGGGGGPTLMFNGHMDTSYSGREPWLRNVPGFQPQAFERDGRLYGLGISNMKGALACYVEAVSALRDAGVRLRGDVLIAAVCGEIEKTQYGDAQGVASAAMPPLAPPPRTAGS